MMEFKNTMSRAELLHFLLSNMEEVKSDPDRERYCANFDQTYKWRKEQYKELTGEEWDNE